MHNNSIIELNSVGVTYRERKSLFKTGEYKALKNISFNVYKGETLGVIGRNGVGKSTLLRVLAGIIKPDTGTISHKTKSVSLMALAAGFDSNLTGRQNAIISGMLLGYRKKHILGELENIKAFSELQEFFEKPTKTYSSGMSARLAFSIAMYVSPEVLLIDEVLGVGDVSFKQKAELAIEDKVASDITVIIVTHSENQLTRLADRVVWIDGGAVRKEGSAQSIFAEYNVNARFSTYGLRVDDFSSNEDFIINFESFEIEEDHLVFTMTIIDQKDRDITLIDDAGKSLHLNGPTATPGLANRYPDISQAASARYSSGKMVIGDRNELILCANGVETKVFEFELNKV